jgi:chaperonin GroEL (HSP60 family)
MSQATFSIPATDFDFAMFEKIKNFIQGQNADIYIRIKTKETQEEANARIDNAIEETEKGINIVSFSLEEFNALGKKLGA